MSEPVKSASVFRLGRAAAVVLVVVAGLVVPSTAEAQRRPERQAPVLLGGLAPPSERSPAPVDPSLPRGAELPSRVRRPLDAPPAGCSTRRPVCVHASEGVPAPLARSTLAALETAWEKLVLVLGLPAPAWDGGGGGTAGLDLYLTSETEEPGGAQVDVGHDLPLDDPFDRAPAFCVVSAAGIAPPDRAATLCLGEAIAWNLDAGATPRVKRAFATHLWWITGRPTPSDLEAVDDVQANPHLALVGREASRLAEGSALFFELLDHELAAGPPGTLATFLLTAASQRTPASAWQWHNEPDLFDALRRNFDDLPQRAADFMGRAAVARAFMGERDDLTHLPSLAWSGAFGTVRFDWVVDFSTLPRNLAFAHPIEPTGSTYVWIDVAKAPEGAGLALRALWEPPVAFKWNAVLVRADGRELRRHDVLFEERGTRAERRIVDLEGAAGVLVVGTNMGGINLDHPFDPDVEPFEPHGLTLYLARL